MFDRMVFDPSLKLLLDIIIQCAGYESKTITMTHRKVCDLTLKPILTWKTWPLISFCVQMWYTK